MSQKQLTNGSLALDEKKVIIIEATKQTIQQKLRVAAYCRVSSDSTDQLNSFMAQTSRYTVLISSKENWSMVDIYADPGISGTSAEKRPDFQRLLSDCHKGHVDKILVKSISRFARNTKECLEIIRELKAIGVGVYFEEQNIDTASMTGELMTAVFSAIAQKESESISGNMRWSYRHRMESGKFIPCFLPYGYVLKDKGIELDEERAVVIRRIFADYLAGKSIDDIAQALTAEEVPCRRGGTVWTSSALRHILKNEKYTGNSIWQKYYTTDTLPFRCLPNKGERDSYYAENTHPPIIPMEDFQAAQELLSQRRQQIVPAKHIPYPFRQKIFCGSCRKVFRRKMVRGIVYWVCMNHDRKGNEHCPVAQIAEENIKEAFLKIYHKLKIHGEPILVQMISDLQTIRERKMLWSMDIVELNKKISDIADQNQMLTEMKKLGLVDSDYFISRSNELAQQLSKAKQEKGRILENTRDSTLVKTKEMMDDLESMPDFLPCFDAEVFGALIERITAESNERLRFHLKNGLELVETIERTVR